MQVSADDAAGWMDDAIEVAREAVACGEAPIGALIVDGQGEVVGRGWNQRRSTGNATRHAEIVAFATAAAPGDPIPEGLILVSTLEPCVMCTGAAMELKVAHIVYGLEAPPNGGTARVNDPERFPEVTGGVRREACRELFVDWLAEHPDAAGAAFVRDLLASTRD